MTGKNKGVLLNNLKDKDQFAVGKAWRFIDALATLVAEGNQKVHGGIVAPCTLHCRCQGSSCIVSINDIVLDQNLNHKCTDFANLHMRLRQNFHCAFCWGESSASMILSMSASRPSSSSFTSLFVSIHRINS
jgi:hypothetical protein